VWALQLLKSHFGVRDPLLVCAYTNVALDNLVERIRDAELKPLRIGIDAKIPDELKEWSFEASTCCISKWKATCYANANILLIIRAGCVNILTGRY
jgi:hypothetical protein